MRGTFLAATILAAVSAVAPASATSFTPAQINSAKAGLQDLRELNVFTQGNLNENSHVQGKTFVGGSLNGTCSTLSCTTGTQNQPTGAAFGQGNGSVGSAVSSRPTLAVVGNTNTSFDLQNGGNGGNGTQGKTVDVGGNLAYTQNVNPDGWTVRVGNTLGAIQNVNTGGSNGPITYGSSYSGSNTGNGRIVKDASLAAGGANDLAASLTSQRTTMVTDLTNLSNVLSSLGNTGSAAWNGNDLALNFTNASATYNAITLNAATFFNNGNAGNLSINYTNTLSPIVINLVGTGGSFIDKMNMNFSDALAANVIFNLVNISGLDVQANWTGSMLGLGTTVMNSSNITGSVAVNIFNQNAEVHLATYGGPSTIIPAPAPVPEPASWMMMIAGFGLLGGALRMTRRRASGISASAG